MTEPGLQGLTSPAGEQVHVVGKYGAFGALLVGSAGAAVCVVAYRKAKRQHESKGIALAGMIVGAVPTVVVVGGFLLFFIVTLIFGA